MILNTHREVYTTNRGRNISAAQSLVDPLSTPLGGWKVEITINGITKTFNASNARSVFAACKKYLKDNKVSVSDLNLWFNLNYQWASNPANRDKFIVPVDDILNALEAKDMPKLYHHPSTWGSVQWNSMAQYLCLPEKSFDYSEFLSVCSITLKLLNPIANPDMGCTDCYGKFSKEIAMMRNKTMTRDECRQWLWSFHNEVNHRLDKPILKYEHAATLHKWT